MSKRQRGSKNEKKPKKVPAPSAPPVAEMSTPIPGMAGRARPKP